MKFDFDKIVKILIATSAAFIIVDLSIKHFGK